MKIAIYGKVFNPNFITNIKVLVNELKLRNAEIIMFEDFYNYLINNYDCRPQINNTFTTYKEITEEIDFLFSIGGDGTFLESVSFVGRKNIPLVGINSGRLGFLADISQEDIMQCIDDIYNNNYSLENRALLEVNTKNNLFGSFNYALNEVTIHKKDTSSMITINAYLNNQLLNRYWADGLIVSTPTGSTAYNLAAGGPIVVPNSENFIITPLAPHNLTVRPIVVADNNEITLTVKGRNLNFLATLDYRSKVFDSSTEINIKKADYSVKVIKLQNHDFFKTLRNKLMWGVDKRN